MTFVGRVTVPDDEAPVVRVEATLPDGAVAARLEREYDYPTEEEVKKRLHYERMADVLAGLFPTQNPV